VDTEKERGYSSAYYVPAGQIICPACTAKITEEDRKARDASDELLGLVEIYSKAGKAFDPDKLLGDIAMKYGIKKDTILKEISRRRPR